MSKKYTMVFLVVSSALLASCTTTTTNSIDTTERQNQQESTQQIEEAQVGVTIGWAEMLQQNTVVDNIISSNEHTTLTTAIEAADLTDPLKDIGPFTVFAPTNSAFENLPEGTLENLLLPENKWDLTAVLMYHVVPGSYTSDKLLDGLTMTSLNGDTLSITGEDGNWRVNGVAINIADGVSINGTIHSIDTVLLSGE